MITDNLIRTIKTRLTGFRTWLTTPMHQDIIYTIKHDMLMHQTINSAKPGITLERHIPTELIVSLTTYGPRLKEVSSAIESIMQGTLKPNRIILCLENELKGTPLPITLQNQQKRGLEILYYKNIRSYLKLIPTLISFPEATVITIDDDAIYAYDLVEKLVNAHKQYPRHIIANRINRIKLNNDGRPLSYLLWDDGNRFRDASTLNFQTGVGGVLYPPHSLHPEAVNDDVFMQLCPNADDVWFYSMALMAGTRVVKCETHAAAGNDYVTNENVQNVSLNKSNNYPPHCEKEEHLLHERRATYGRVQPLSPLGQA